MPHGQKKITNIKQKEYYKNSTKGKKIVHIFLKLKKKKNTVIPLQRVQV